MFAGALFKLTHASAWEQHGTLTPDEAAALALAMYNSISDGDGECVNDPLGQINFYPHQLYELPEFIERWFLCDGSHFLKADFPDYWSQLSLSSFYYIWEFDADNFSIPDIQQRFIYGTNDEPGFMGGASTHTLVTGEIPAHAHSVNIPGVVNVQAGVGATPNTLPGLPGLTGNSGGGGAHNNMPPHIVLCPYIKLRY